jgi:ABC-2 type transport system permease protein
VQSNGCTEIFYTLKGVLIMILKYIKTAQMTAQSQTNGGIFYLLLGYLLRGIYLIPLLFLWRSLMSSGVDSGMSLQQILTYTYISTLIGDLLVIRSRLSDWLYEGLVISLFQRPITIFGQVIFQTLGECVPLLLLFSLPMALVAPLFGVSLMPVSLWFIPSLVLCISLGFAIDFMFACLLIRLMNARWLVTVIRNAVVWLFSGSFIPFVALPFGIGNVFSYLPFGSLGGAPLSIYTGLSKPIKIILIQLFWNLILWPFAIYTFKKSQERLVSHGG